jgi:hypothetical protein
MSKATLLCVCNASMATVAAVGAAYVIIGMFLPPPATPWVPTQLRSEPMPALSSQQSALSSQQSLAYTGANRSQLQPVKAGQVAAIATSTSPGIGPESDSSGVLPSGPRQFVGKDLIYGRPTPLPPNVPKLSQINPGLGDF